MTPAGRGEKRLKKKKKTIKFIFLIITKAKTVKYFFLTAVFLENTTPS